ncbi:MAG: hypothetical protein IKD43_05375 [Clostridia bacterium]|nr:hypothetical protein [Clostridia bacterium]
MRESFIFYASFYEAIKELADNSQLAVLRALIAYAVCGEEPQLSGAERAVFLLMKPQIDANNRRYENGKRGGKFGILGGRPKKEENPTKTPNVNVNENENVNENKIKESKNKKERRSARASRRSADAADARADRERFYSLRQQKSEAAARRNQKRAEAIPGYLQLAQRVRRGVLEVVKGRLSEEAQAAQVAELEELLKRAGLSRADLEPVPICKQCSDSGWKEDGRPCECYKNSPCGVE